MHSALSTTKRTRRGIAVAASSLAAGAMLLPGGAAAAEVFFATTPSNELVQFTSQAPARILTREPIGGLAAGETIVGMDQRPATGQLYALTSTGRLLVIERSSGDIRAIGAAIPLTGTQFGFDFNPVADRIRITSDTDINLRVHPDTGVVTADTNLSYAPGDAGAGADPFIAAAGYTFSAFGNPPATTELFGIDASRDSLVKQDPPNAGTLSTVGALGVDGAAAMHLDIAGDQTRYAAFARQGETAMQLWRINTAGAASAAGTPSTIGEPVITSLASVGSTRDDTRAPFVSVGNYTTWRGVWLDRGLRFTITCTEDCTVTTTLRIGDTVAGTATETMTVAGTRAPRITLNAASRRLAARTGLADASLTFESVDLAGNTRTQVAEFDSLPGTNPVG